MEDAKFINIHLNENQLNAVTTMFSPHWHVVNKEKTDAGLYKFDIIHTTEIEN
ncbi:hypothetical protein SAMN05877753_102650 [Bacillus oleivorans]|uniref:Uncharacterized protein n=1 Tax=Bacillus oleivorans TaxID=1448271 RepID=A0A285CMB3_9BACI|nr:hypothetical protein [Bacillus oleivorans]SNX68671.1 hypothetical protein SAMN05877753_102650 [Bacillus oleivorans]